mgnify:CR=1 FL=1
MGGGYIVGGDNVDGLTKSVQCIENTLVGHKALSIDTHSHISSFNREFVATLTDSAILTPSSTNKRICIRDVYIAAVAAAGSVSIHFNSSNIVAKYYLTKTQSSNVQAGHIQGALGETLKITTPSTEAVFLIVNYVEHS